MTNPTQPPEATFSDRVNPDSNDGQYVPPEFTPEPVPPLKPVGPQADAQEPEPAGTQEAIYRRNTDGSYSAVTVTEADKPVEMPTWNHYVHTASGKVFQVYDPPAGPHHIDDDGNSHQIIGVYPR